MTEREAHLAWQLCKGVGPVTLELLTKRCGSAASAWLADEAALQEAGMTLAAARKLIQHRQHVDWQGILTSLEKTGIVYVSRVDTIYPADLLEIKGSPIGLFGIGNWDLLLPEVKRLAVVGTRRITDYGRQVTRSLVNELVTHQVVIVSGLMFGVDEVGQRACIASGGKTIGVWAGGLDTLWQGSRDKLAQAVVAHDGLLLSEYPPGVTPSPAMFPARNRIVSGISQGVLVTEGSSKSGTLITAGFAAEQGKEVYAVPGPITSKQSEASTLLLKAGAVLVSSAEDILDGLGLDGEKSEILVDLLCDEHQEIWNALGDEPLSSDELSRKLAWDIAGLGSVLTMMEIDGLLLKQGDKWLRARK